MRVLRGVEEAASAPLGPCVATLGVFDGVHTGHRLVLREALQLARERSSEAAVVTFSRHPLEVVKGPGQGPPMILALDQRLARVAELGIATVLVLDFDEALRSWEAEAFAHKVFAQALRAELVLLGYDNRFGKGGRGDFATLERVGAEAGFEARRSEEVRLGQEPVSSTRIREAVFAGELNEAARMLGRPVTLYGEVIHGDAIGATLGFPTANLQLQHGVRPPRGVYGCRLELCGRLHHALVNIGYRPTVTGADGAAPGAHDWLARMDHERVEVHVLDFDGDLYGECLEVELLMHLREERRFDGLESLQKGIAADVHRFREWVGRGEGEKGGECR